MIAIGAVIGFVMGLTGAGGALIAIPLFMQHNHMTLKEASVLSLLAVVIASFSNFIFQRKGAQISLALHFTAASAAGSFLALPFKKVLSDVVLATLLAVISLYALHSVWRPQKKEPLGDLAPVGLLVTVLLGLFLGVLTTLTGLGGGVLLLAVMLSVYKLPQAQAVATSLLIVSLSSLASFLIQGGGNLSLGWNLLGLVAGILGASYLLKLLLTKPPEAYVQLLRKVVFTFVVVIALVKIF